MFNPKTYAQKKHNVIYYVQCSEGNYQEGTRKTG